MEASHLLPPPEEELLGEHGEIFTRRWVVELILDLAGYTEDRDLGAFRAVEPACGSGAFLVPMVERLVRSAKAHGRDLRAAHDALLAMDLLTANVERSRAEVTRVLRAGALSAADAQRLATHWIRRHDFLLDAPADRSVDLVVGNPPYLRLEAVPAERSAAYRRACPTMGGRADVYIGFYEHGLRALKLGGTLGFICADRWMRNAYGARLRQLIASGWSMETLISLTGVDAFEEAVDAYPAITILRRGAQTERPVVVEGTAAFAPDDAGAVVRFARSPEAEHAQTVRYRASRLHTWFGGGSGWPHGSPDEIAVLADLEQAFPPLEDAATGTKVGIGVATGADRVFIVRDADLVEPERLLPLALPRDIASGEVVWSGRYLVNPWDSEGLVDLDAWPRLADYFRVHRESLSRRHTAKSGRWHKTIDRVIEGLTDRPKLYLPDFKEEIFPVLDEGRTYPHHNLYWVTSTRWDIRVLGGLLMTDIANLFIKAYSVRMRGGYLRFQAQYLRRIRLPRVEDVDEASASALVDAFMARDRAAATAVALRLYGLPALPR